MKLGARELKGAVPFYGYALMQKFGARLLPTTAARISKRTIKAAKLYHTHIHDRQWLDRALRSTGITMAEVSAKNSHLESI